MVNNQTETLNTTFAALADPTRRAILTRLSQGESSVTALAEPFQVSLPAISKQLRVLERAGLLVQEKDGRVRRCRLEVGPMKQAVDWISQYRRFWDQQLEFLASYLEDVEPKSAPLRIKQITQRTIRHDSIEAANRDQLDHFQDDQRPQRPCG